MLKKLDPQCLIKTLRICGWIKYQDLIHELT